LAEGKDGYDVFKSCEQLVREYCIYNKTVNLSHMISAIFCELTIVCGTAVGLSNDNRV